MNVINIPGKITIASISKGYTERTARNAMRKTSTDSAEANNGRHIEVTTVKKNEPPVMNARRYSWGVCRVKLR